MLLSIWCVTSVRSGVTVFPLDTPTDILTCVPKHVLTAMSSQLNGRQPVSAEIAVVLCSPMLFWANGVIDTLSNMHRLSQCRASVWLRPFDRCKCLKTECLQTSYPCYLWRFPSSEKVWLQTEQFFYLWSWLWPLCKNVTDSRNIQVCAQQQHSVDEPADILMRFIIWGIFF